MVKTQNHKRTTMNKTKKQCPKNCQTLTTFHSFEKEYEKGIKNTLVKSHRNIPNFYRPLNIKPMTKIGFNYLKKYSI